MKLEKNKCYWLKPCRLRLDGERSVAISHKFGAMFGLNARIKKCMSLRGKACLDVAISYKRGAMFGLDARIALAIFGALSVISGVALYGAIKEARITAFISELNEIGKAWEQYLLDTSSDLPAVSVGPKTRLSSELVVSSKLGWKGPYLTYEKAIDSRFLKHNKYGEVHLLSAKGGQWGVDGDWRTSDSDCTATDCYLWVHINKIESGINEKVDEIIDGGDGGLVGKVRWYDNPVWNDLIFLQYVPYDLPIFN